MLITCKCLNVSICVKGENIQRIDVTSLGLATNVQNDPFFKEELGTVDLVRICKEQPSLVQTRNIGSWIVHYCLNCSMDSHAINREKGASFVLVSCKMVVDPSQVSALKDSVNYSPVYRIIISGTNDTSLVETKLSAPHMPSSMQAALSALQQQLHQSLQREAQAVEERVRNFQDQQDAHLDEFRRRAHEDHRSLAKLLFEKFEDAESPIFGANLHTPPAIVDGNEAPSLAPPPELKREWLKDNKADISSDASGISDSELLEPRESPAKATRSARSALVGAVNRSARGSLDSEGLFPLEGMDRNVDMDPDEELDDVAPVTGRAAATAADPDADPQGDAARGMGIARSLPVTVPSAFGRKRCQGDAGDEDADGVPQDNPMYIAASIKALAKSVYGDNPFGELPRPRFSSQI